MQSPSFVISLNSLVNSFFTFPFKLPPEMKSDRVFKLRSVEPNNSVGSADFRFQFCDLTSPIGRFPPIHSISDVAMSVFEPVQC